MTGYKPQRNEGKVLLEKENTPSDNKDKTIIVWSKPGISEHKRAH